MKPRDKHVFYERSAGTCFIASIFLLLISSCVTQKDVEYLQDKTKTTKSFNEALVGDYKLKPNDELYIQITSLDEAAANVFSGSGTQQSLYIATIEPYGASLISYAVDKDGYVLLPVIGKIPVKDETTVQVSDQIKEALKNILSQPVVSVKLVNRYVSVLGEVKNPGQNVNDFLNSGLFGVNQNFQNELWVLKSSPVVEQTIRNLDLTVSYFRKEGFQYLEVYNNKPFRVLLLQNHVQPVNLRFNLFFAKCKHKHYKFTSEFFCRINVGFCRQMLLIPP